MKNINLKKFIQDTKGATMVEYALMLFAVLICAAVAMKAIGPKVAAAGSSTVTNLQAG
jgi:Flp pilus assembly pilin Flp